MVRNSSDFIACDNKYVRTLKKLCVDCGYVLHGVSKNHNGDVIIDIEPCEIDGNPFNVTFTIKNGGIESKVDFVSISDGDVISTIIELERAVDAKCIIDYVFRNYRNF